MHEVVKQVLERSGFSEINPVQKKALGAGILDGESLVVAAPTASGKTLVAEFAALNTIKKGKKVVYIVPLRALASEKYEEFQKKYKPLGVKIAISIGDLDKSDPWLAKFDFIIVTSEKFDSLLRHGIHWLDQIGLVVIDEIHLLNDPGRGPTLEIIITKLKTLVNPQILGLSATIRNYKEIAEWLGAKSVKSEYRPVKLYKGICFNREIYYQPKRKSLELENEFPETIEITKDTLLRNKQALIFVSTRRNTESLAERVGKIVRERLKQEEVKKLRTISEKILKVIEKPTMQCEKLANCVRHGVAFHHAGITNEQRRIIENGFKEGIIKVITATPTLAYGVNLPSWRVVIRDLKRFDAGRGMDYIPVLEAQQMMGRSGRPKYDKEGEAILIAKSKGEAEHVWDTYINGEPEEIVSKLGVEPVLRMHTLALIASNIITSKASLFDFFSKTFYACQYEDLSSLKRKLEDVIELLKGYNFIKSSISKESPFRSALSLTEDERLEATRLGKRVSELYIDPLTANYLINNLEKAKSEGLSPFGLLQLISHTIEMSPGLNLRRNDFEKINEILINKEKELIEKPPNPWDIEYDDYLRSIKTAVLFLEWMDEMGEDEILEHFGVTPGELRVRLNNADWLLYATQELALLLGMMNMLSKMRKIRIRMKYGIREELLPLIRLKGIGRVRARLLYNSNIRTLSKLRKIPIESLSRLIGPKLARSTKEQLNELKESK
jgi:helicase